MYGFKPKIPATREIGQLIIFCFLRDKKMRLFSVAGGLPAKRKKDIPEDVRRGIEAMRRIEQGINPSLVGTAKHKQAFFGDIDLLTKFDGDLNKLANTIQNVVRKLPPDFYFSDMKIGGTKARGRHWTKRQVIAGKNGKLGIVKALSQPAVTKLDVIIPVKTKFGQRFVELTNFIFIKGVSAPFGDFLEEMLKDIEKYAKKNQRLKVIKRKLSSLLWTDKKRDQLKIKRLFEPIKGRPGYLGSLLADMETARLLVKNKALQKKQLTYLSRALGTPITMRNLKANERRLGREINSLLK